MGRVAGQGGFPPAPRAPALPAGAGRGPRAADGFDRQPAVGRQPWNHHRPAAPAAPKPRRLPRAAGTEAAAERCQRRQSCRPTPSHPGVPHRRCLGLRNQALLPEPGAGGETEAGGSAPRQRDLGPAPTSAPVRSLSCLLQGGAGKPFPAGPPAPWYASGVGSGVETPVPEQPRHRAGYRQLRPERGHRRGQME